MDLGKAAQAIWMRAQAWIERAKQHEEWALRIPTEPGLIFLTGRTARGHRARARELRRAAEQAMLAAQTWDGPEAA